MPLEFCVTSDVVCGGYDECGYPLERLVYYVLAEGPTGRRFAHFKTYYSEAEAMPLLRVIEQAYAAGRPIDTNHWQEIDPAYGSEAYQALDAEKFFRNREIMEAHDAGEISERTAFDLMMR